MTNEQLIQTVAQTTSVDASYLMEDGTFLDLVRECGRTMTEQDAVQTLVNHVDENY